MRKLKKILLFFLLTSRLFYASVASAQTPVCWSVSGAGTSAANGVYSLYTANGGVISTHSGDTWVQETGTPSYTLNGAVLSTFALLRTANGGTPSTYNADELKGVSAAGELTDANGYYYGIHSPGGDFSTIDTLNAGSSPVPTIAQVTCPTSLPATSTIQAVDNVGIDLGIGFALFLAGMWIPIYYFRPRNVS